MRALHGEEPVAAASRSRDVGAVLLDPRGYWAPRDCPLAQGLEDAVRLTLAD